MKFLRQISFLVLATGMALAQTSTPSSPTVADELKALREAIAAQQKQISQQQHQIETLTQALDERNAGTPHVAEAALRTGTASPVTVATAVQADKEKPKESPLSFRIGGTEFTPGGFVEFQNVFRSTNTGNVSATNFWSIPFSNTPAGHLTEFRSTGQYSRYSLKVAGKYGENNILGYLEGDFNGNDAANVFVTSNSHTNRLRVYWVDLKRGKWEFLGGQTWGLLTPNRTGMSPMPSDLAITIGDDAQTHVGLNYTRANEFRLIRHFNDKFQWGVAMENAQQFIGQGNEVIFPSAFNAALGGQFDNGAVPGAPNAYPDLMTKMAYDSTLGGRKFHFEAGGLMTSAKTAIVPTLAAATFSKHTKIGAGMQAALNYEVFKGLRVLGSGMWGTGIGRYLIGMGPQAVVAPVPAIAGGTCTPGAAGGCDVAISMVRSGTALLGVEAQAGSKTQFGFYYGGAYFQRSFFKDLTLAAQPNIGFGAPNAATASIMNRAIQEGSFEWTQTFWKNPQYGAVLLVTQGSYVTRSPWFVPTGAPKNAHLGMGFVSMRYVLP
jgi:hypothetical protein